MALGMGAGTELRQQMKAITALLGCENVGVTL
jgi:hypothetical protein